MACGFLNIQYESIVLPYNDETTPKSLTGIKMLPIFEFDDGAINESLDIILRLDKDNRLNARFVIENQCSKLDQLTDKIGKDVHNLAMPYWIWTPEFDENSRQYFEKKKSAKRGPFKNLVHKKEEFISSLNQTLAEISPMLTPYYNGQNMDLADIIIAAHLWGMYIVPEFQFPAHIHLYLQNVAKNCHFHYHEDYWR